jgi:hypothetical protein
VRSGGAEKEKKTVVAERALGVQVDKEVDLVVEPWPGLVFNRLADGSRRLQEAQHCIINLVIIF